MQKNFIKNVEEPYRRPPTLKVYEYYTSSKPFGIADIGGKYLGSGLKKKILIEGEFARFLFYSNCNHVRLQTLQAYQAWENFSHTRVVQ